MTGVQTCALPILELFEPVVANEVELDSVVWDSVYEGGRNVILGSAVGTQLFDKYLPVAVGGKSGTAEENKNRGSHANYITWAPYNNAEVAVEVLDKDGEVIENEYTVVFNKPYTFEGETYDKIDLSGLDNLTAADMIAANKILDRTGSFTFLPEMSLEYACIIAAKATKLPVEFFKGLHPKEAVKVKNRVTAFFYGAE